VIPSRPLRRQQDGDRQGGLRGRHYCSSSSIPASDIYKEGKISRSRRLDESRADDGAFAKGNTTVFRTVGRDDIQGPAMANYVLKTSKNAKDRDHPRQDDLRKGRG
jgi:ABC-type branched-chain amino acid transport systems, periplasmic component